MAFASTFRFPKLVRRFGVPFGFFASAIITWPILAEYEIFEEFYEFSRAHEDWDLDEFALLVINLSIALMLTVIFQWTKLKHLVKEREDQRRRAESNARHDPLTGLMNRRAFAEAMRRIARGAGDSDERVIAMIDLDRFKPVNDLHGHAAGDATLRLVADRLTECIGPGSTVARLGGDEFAVLFKAGSEIAQIERTTRKLLHLLEEPIVYEDAQIYISGSIGLVRWTCTTSSAEALRKADKALYTSKIEGKGQFAWYDADLDRKSHERAEIEADLREAISNDEIEPWFQPIILIGENRLVGFEVLARWTHQSRGQIPPGVFIEIAEDSGQIGRLGLGLLRKACNTAKGWDARLSVSFNISPHQFRDPQLVESIKEILNDSGFDPTRLTIEVTESSIIRDFDLARAKLDALKALGVCVALDDFGTGYSSLASLRQLPFDRIKIDRSFVTNIASKPQNQRIVTGIMALANGLELDVTAEGIETWDDLHFLQSLECPLGQGFLFDKAIPADEVSWFLETKWREFHVDPGRGAEAAESPQNKAG